MTFLANAGWSVLSWLGSILVMIAWPLQFVGDLLCLPSKWITRKVREQDLEELRRVYSSLVVDPTQVMPPPPTEKAN